jgi:glucuronate isomerase
MGRSKINNVKEFITDTFLLNSETAIILYEEYAKNLPIIDFHTHLSPEEIANNKQFNSISELWLNGDHYKWRAMRANGVDEKYCTGNASDKEKFIQWARTVPNTLRNPLYHWTHLELKRYFGIDDLLNGDNAEFIYDQCNEMLQAREFSVRRLLSKMNVEVVCTTDDPVDLLSFHSSFSRLKNPLKMYPSFRPDKVLAIGSNEDFMEWINELEKVTYIKINSLEGLLNALKVRIQHFSSLGCRISDHGLPEVYGDDFTEDEVKIIFDKLLAGQEVSVIEKRKYSSAMLYYLSGMYKDADWVQQYHVGAIRNNRSKIYNEKGPDVGCDSINDAQNAEGMSKFLDRLDKDEKLTKTILYNLNPAFNEVFATMIANFNDGKTKGKMQYGPAWWFMDQKDGIKKQLNTVSNFGLLSNFVGMVTDSRSFLSYSRHEYFRRILCDILGNEMERGELPADLPLVGNMVKNICYHNAKNYFNF